METLSRFVRLNPDLELSELTHGERLFTREIDFLKGVVQPKELPEQNRVEICFCGRSNVGKSSLINALTNRKNLARTSNTPGRTQEINFFTLSDSYYLVDLPGYGFAKMPHSIKVKRQNFLIDYLRARAAIRRVFALVDSRHGPKKIDLEIFSTLNSSAVSFQLVYTKVDKIKNENYTSLLSMAEGVFKEYPVMLPEVILTSKKSNQGVSYLRKVIADIQ